MSQPLVVEQSRAIPATGGRVPGLAADAAAVLFRRWYGPIPPIKQVLDQTGDWGAVGQTRTVALVGGGSMREELTQSTHRARSVTPSRISRVR